VTSGLNRMQHCLGGQAYNAVKNGLIAAGMTADRINTISHGKESPFCRNTTKPVGSKTVAAISCIGSNPPKCGSAPFEI